jgi:pyruvate/2-oxoglutarate dehydrogenase complex dihydrolipoamide acyltransferase (E2) component
VSGSASARLSPAVRQLARVSGIDPASLRGSGQEGRVTRRDMQAAIAARPEARAAELEELVPATSMRRAIAEHMVRSVRTSAHAWVLFEIDVTRLVAYRAGQAEGFRARHGLSLNYLPFVIQLVCDALRRFPLLNSSWSEDGPVLHGDLHIGVAISVENGLVVPVVRHADRLGLTDLARAIDDLAARARSRRLRPEDVQGGTFTVNNSGVIGAVTSKPILNQPQVGMMTTQKIVKRPLVFGDSIEIRDVMNSALSFDHRVLSIFEAGEFMAEIKRRLEGWTPADIRP